ncbi:hypothetical protein AB0K14_27765 [Actinosynnema sp. NPDC050801]|uniref:hypothetical protein n=1 Tax=unclassified Actinosynnema TaxID=2637065 RepID=UPI0033E5D315
MPSTGLSRDSAYAAGTSTASCTAHTPTATTIVLRKYRPRSIRSHASAYVPGVHVRGRIVGGTRASSAAGFMAESTTHTRGTTKTAVSRTVVMTSATL